MKRIDFNLNMLNEIFIGKQSYEIKSTHVIDGQKFPVSNCLIKTNKGVIHGVYGIQNIVNKRIYIGSSKNVRKRLCVHVRDLKNNKHYNEYLQNSWNKYGENNFRFLLLASFSECNNELKMLQEEQWFIDFYYSYKRNFGYNINKNTNKIPNNTGNKRPDLTKFNIEIKSKKVKQYDQEGKFIKEWPSVSNAAKNVGVNKTSIASACKRYGACNGFKWRY